MLKWASLVCACAIAACAPSSADAPIPEQWRSVVVDAHPVELGAARVGGLVFRGGLVLRSEDPGFGGFSDLKVSDDGKLIAISDDGRWLSGVIDLDAEGKLVGLSEPRLALMRDEHAQPFERKAAGDAEDMAQLPDGRIAVAFEQTQSIRIYDLNRDGPFGAATLGPPLAGTAHLAPNFGIEALAATASGDLIVGAEQAHHGVSDVWRVGLDASTPTAATMHYPLSLGFGLASMDHLPDGDFITLERFYAPVIGARIRLCRIRATDLEGGGEIRKTEIALLQAPLSIDNFEGVAAVRGPNGGVRLYLISDNNFDARWRTLLYAFDLME